jgi:uncharacterized protein YukE
VAVDRFELPRDGLLAARVCLSQRTPAGDPIQLRSVARRSGGWAADLRRVAATLLSCTETPVWSGAAHRAFVADLRESTPSMTATAERYERYAGALNAYAGVLDETGPLLVTTRNRLRQRYDELASQGFGTTGFGVGALTAGSAPDTADLLPLAGTFKAGYDRWADALDRCTAALSQADLSDPARERHGFAEFAHQVTGAVGAVVSPFEQAVLHPSLRNLSNCFQALNVDLTVLGLGLLFICPAVGAACLAAATVLAVAQLAVDSARRERGEPVSAGSLGFELAAAVPVGGNAVRGLRSAAKVTHLVPGGGLMAHEGLDGGHTLAKHVGKSEAFLRNRLATEPHITAASTFYDRQTAEITLSAFMDANAAEIARWLPGGSKTLVLIGRAVHPVGPVILRGAPRPVEASGIRLVLKRNPTMSTGYRIHTAMVEL